MSRRRLDMLNYLNGSLQRGSACLLGTSVFLVLRFTTFKMLCHFNQIKRQQRILCFISTQKSTRTHRSSVGVVTLGNVFATLKTFHVTGRTTHWDQANTNEPECIGLQYHQCSTDSGGTQIRGALLPCNYRTSGWNPCFLSMSPCGGPICTGKEADWCFLSPLGC